MKILMTGANGLLGYRFLNTHTECHDIHALVRLKQTSLFENVTYHNVDLSRDWNNTDLPENIDVVMHLAQSSHFREFPEQALDIFNVNVSSTAKLLDYALKAKAKKFIFASSGGIYGNGEEAFKENSHISDFSKLGYYLASKCCSEALVQSYAAFMDIIILRIFFLYGKGQNRTMLIPRLVDNVLSGQHIKLQGDQGIRINPIHVNDAALVLLKTLSLTGSHTFNVGGCDVLSLREIAEIIGSTVNKQPVFEIENTESKALIGDIENMKTALMVPQVSFREGVVEVIPK